MYNNQLVYEVVIWAFFEIILWKGKVALKCIIFYKQLVKYIDICNYIQSFP